MKYYRITQSFESKNTGQQGFIKDFINKQGLNNPRGLGNLPQGERVLIDPIIPDHVVNNRAKINDFHLTGGPLGNRFLISENLKRKFSEFREELFQFFPVPIIQGEKKIEGYWVTHILQYDTNQIDFTKTQFIYQKSRKISKPFYPFEFENSEEKIEFESWDSFQAFSKNELTYLDSLTAINPKIKISNPYPIIAFRGVGINDLIIKEEVMKILEEERFIGLEYWPLEIPDEEWFGPNGLRRQFYK